MYYPLKIKNIVLYWTYINGGEHVCHKMWTQDERSRSSTWIELSAIESVSHLSCLPILHTSHVKWYTGNQVTVKTVEICSMKLELAYRNLVSFIVFCGLKQCNC